MRSVAISFTSGQTVDETPATWLLVPFGLLTLLAILAFWRRAEKLPRATEQHSPRVFRILSYALLWLVLPVGAILLLASLAPKFNARYVMLALPGLLLVWAAGFSKGLEIGDWRPGTGDWGLETGDWRLEIRRRRSISDLRSLISNLSLLFVLITCLYADLNWFINPAFTKDEWRDVAAFLHARIRPDETVILVSGHAWPVWHCTAPDLPAVRLPNIDVLDVNAVLTFTNTVAPLQAAFAKETGKTGTWIVEWQEDVVDPTGIIPVQLELAGREKGQPTPFWNLKLRRFANIKPKHIAAAPPITTAINANFGNQLLLHGYRVLDNGDLLLFWTRTATAQTPAADLQIAGQVWTADGAPVAQLADQRPAGYGYPVTRSPAGEIVMGRLPAATWLGDQVVDGTYKLRLSVYTVTLGVAHKLLLPNGQDFIELAPLVVQLD